MPRAFHEYHFELFGNHMTRSLIIPGEPAPDFELEDTNGNRIRLSGFHGRKPVVLAFLRGFT